ncbi:hypothetical protein BO79DRAFT_256810 [Aspergillus costaricaensis CBS 115574]|uniref:Uncharacterized protein n=1 Tax=Aspergillus costaricaensis CBS 115574 TaxID=1448317 RepID=A0ACD1I8T8_9EURO|nr:hypothetical protein BO79DRAFT_256810 [Aspergillus costaricaensis CBS 115574]RAK86868.1 hypothetical protein BO79DRAFT_256810 [Aspergillus costaricaensis CBS 115574]
MGDITIEYSVNIDQDGRAVVKNPIGAYDNVPHSGWQPSVDKRTSEIKKCARNARAHKMSITETAPDDGVAVTGVVNQCSISRVN